ncbi:MAG: nucleoside deaminase [Bacteroidales bacterium]|jgi:tRNA(adenine34) deaminase|nr:nucleoside deaminase [Bacteroidales bacterium]
MKLSVFSDEYYMQQALNEALIAEENDEVPVGAVIVCNDKIIARAHNQVEQLNDVTAHAEMLALTSAFNAMGAKYLDNCTLYVTLEPCVMCAGALAHAHVSRVVWACDDTKNGFSKHGNLLHPKAKIQKGILEEECLKVLKGFFERKRK